MNKIKEFKYMPNLKKSELYSFMSMFNKLKIELDKEENDRPDIISTDAGKERYNEVTAKLNALVVNLGLSFNKRSPSPESIYIVEQKRLIQSAYSSIREVLKANLRFKLATDYDKILNLSLLIKKYSKISTANLKEITALVDNLLRDLAVSEYTELIKKLLLTDWISSMTVANDNFKSYSLKRSDTYEQIVSYNYRMKQDIINNYHEMEFCINALAFNGSFTKYDEFVNSLNGIITDYIEIIQKRLSTFKNKKKNDRPDIISTNDEDISLKTE